MAAKAQKPNWCIAITFGDEENNGFVTLGGATWDTQVEWEQHWQAIQVSPLGSAMLIADKLDQHGVRIEEKRINAATAEWMLGYPLGELLKRAERKRPSPGGRS
ncbi:hypothetical protein [Pseudomonas zeae]|uniref:hypothetical protein n=1 Tax=Pseudomonas zeae TaxID=2745510 RepID=UPI0039E18AB8